jgi:hypothetical protein
MTQFDDSHKSKLCKLATGHRWLGLRTPRRKPSSPSSASFKDDRSSRPFTRPIVDIEQLDRSHCRQRMELCLRQNSRMIDVALCRSNSSIRFENHDEQLEH